MTYTCFDYVVSNHVAHIKLNRPDALNTMNKEFWDEIPAVFKEIDKDPSVRAVVISSTGKHFSAGLDLNWAGQTLNNKSADLGRAREYVRRHIMHMQDTITAVDKCRVPVIAAIQGGAIGGAVDLITACDIRVGSADSFYVIQEVNVAIVADVGTLQRLPHLLPQGLIRELAYTGRRWPAEEARATGFLNHVHPTHEATVEAALAMAAEIASKSPLVITGIKQVLDSGRDMTIAQGLDYVATWNAGMLQGDDMKTAITAQFQKTKAVYEDLLA